MSHRQISSELCHKIHYLHDLLQGTHALENVLNSLGIVEDNASNAVLLVFHKWVPGKAQAIKTQLEAMQKEWMEEWQVKVVAHPLPSV